AASGASVTVPITIVANGNENALGLSLSFNPALLNFDSASTGTGASGAALLLNTNQLPSGKLGLALALPAGSTLAAGTQQVVQVTFTTGIVTNPTSASVSFADTPIARQLTDVNGYALPAGYAGATITIAPAEFEADVFPRPGGDHDVNISDWVLIGRYV